MITEPCILTHLHALKKTERKKNSKIQKKKLFSYLAAREGGELLAGQPLRHIRQAVLQQVRQCAELAPTAAHAHQLGVIVLAAVASGENQPLFVRS